jgi:hypothetical protein
VGGIAQGRYSGNAFASCGDVEPAQTLSRRTSTSRTCTTASASSPWRGWSRSGFADATSCPPLSRVVGALRLTATSPSPPVVVCSQACAFTATGRSTKRPYSNGVESPTPQTWTAGRGPTVRPVSSSGDEESWTSPGTRIGSARGVRPYRPVAEASSEQDLCTQDDTEGTAWIELKHHWPQGRAGSIPAPGTDFLRHFRWS